MPDPNLYSAPQEAIFSWSHFVAALKSPFSFSSLAIFPWSSAAWWSSLSFKSLLLTLRAASLKSAAGFPGRISAVDLRFFGLLVMVARLFFYSRLANCPVHCSSRKKKSSDCIREFFLLSFAGVFWNSATFVMRRLGVRVSCFGADPLSDAGVCRSFKKR